MEVIDAQGFVKVGEKSAAENNSTFGSLPHQESAEFICYIEFREVLKQLLPSLATIQKGHDEILQLESKREAVKTEIHDLKSQLQEYEIELKQGVSSSVQTPNGKRSNSDNANNANNGAKKTKSPKKAKLTDSSTATTTTSTSSKKRKSSGGESSKKKKQ